MRLLVSVRSAAEAKVALAGGADIIDAKEPSRGSLGAVSPKGLQQIWEVIPEDHPMSVALGDPKTAGEIRRMISAVPQSERLAYLKLGFAGVRDPDVIHHLLEAALESAAGRPLGIVAVAYVDAPHARSLPPESIGQIAGETGVAGVLLDTYQKAAGNLLTWLAPARLAALLTRVRAAQLFTAVAGGLGFDQLPAVFQAAPDIVGFRGALCEGGRERALSLERVRRVRRLLSRMTASGSIPPFEPLRALAKRPAFRDSRRLEMS
jgi:uncharacterized protein (UPF0264 family)